MRAQSEGIKRREIWGGADPHIWLNPQLVKEQAKAIRSSHIRLDPEGKSEYEAGYAGFAAHLNELHSLIAEAIGGAMEDSIVTFRNVSFAYDAEPVLQNIYFKVFSGDFVSLVGPNGGGKTTLLKLILGLLKPGKGSINVFSKSPERANGAEIGSVHNRGTRPAHCGSELLIL